MSKRFSSVTQASEFLLGHSPEKLSGQTYTLERMKELMCRLGNPQNDIAAVHIAGTSGKTSTAYYVRALLQVYGKRTGLTSSPHIRSITERVQIDGAALADSKFLRYLEEFVGILDAWHDIQPTYFELLTAFAFWTFKKEQVDYMIIEVGLGGLLDATNVMQGPAKVSVITPIGLDHTEILGNTVALIAYQKAGIINNDSDVFTTLQDEEVMKVIKQRAVDVSARLHTVTREHEATKGVPLFQQRNFGLAATVVSFIARRDGLNAPPQKMLDQAIHATPPGRFERYKIGDKTIILDGAHNPQKITALLDSLHTIYDGPFGFLIGFIAGQDQKIDDCLTLLIRDQDEYIVTEFTVGQDIKGRQSVSASLLMSKMLHRTSSVIAQPNATLALQQLLEMKQPTVVVTGSLYLVALLREQVIASAATQ